VTGSCCWKPIAEQPLNRVALTSSAKAVDFHGDNVLELSIIFSLEPNIQIGLQRFQKIAEPSLELVNCQIHAREPGRCERSFDGAVITDISNRYEGNCSVIADGIGQGE
jgi:hypothetical protein